MRYAHLAFAIAALTAHALFLHPLLIAQHSSESDEINLAVWIFGCGLILLEAYCLRSSAPASEPDQPMSIEEAQQLLNAQMRAVLDNIELAPGPDMHDAITYGMSAHWIGIDPAGGDDFTHVAIPIMDLFKPMEAAPASERATASPAAPIVAGVDLAKPAAEPKIVMRARRQGKKFTYDRVMAAA